jgi:hypothetical protein
MLRFISLFISVLAVSGSVFCPCGAHVHAQEITKKRSDSGERKVIQDGGPMESDTGEFYLRLSDEDRRALLDKVQTIKVGDSRQSVEALLGKPWSDYSVATKKKGRFVYRAVKYYLAKKDKDLVNERWDEWVMLDFNSDDKLERINTRISSPGAPGSRP